MTEMIFLSALESGFGNFFIPKFNPEFIREASIPKAWTWARFLSGAPLRFMPPNTVVVSLLTSGLCFESGWLPFARPLFAIQDLKMDTQVQITDD